MRKFVNECDLAAMQKMANEGLTRIDAANRLGFSSETIGYHARRRGIFFSVGQSTAGKLAGFKYNINKDKVKPMQDAFYAVHGFYNAGDRAVKAPV